jgi:alpha-tubulin suppressor-like RCC1 family protein
MAVDVSGLTSGVADIAVGYDHACALLTGGGMKCWGDNADGELGNGDSPNDSDVPVDVTGLTSEVASVYAGANVTCASKSGGAIKCWGNSSYDNFGVRTGDISVPQDYLSFQSSEVAHVAVSENAGKGPNCILFNSGRIQCVGRILTNHSVLGNGIPNNGNGNPIEATWAYQKSGFSQISSKQFFTCAVLSDSTGRCWGKTSADGRTGQDNSIANYSSPTTITGLSDSLTKISAGNRSACALTTAGGVKCWGEGSKGELGNGGTADSVTAVQVTGLTSNVLDVEVGNGQGGGGFACALLSGGGVKCWGDGEWSGMGNGTNTVVNSTPVDVTISDVTQIGVGGWHACALTTSGGVKCWGYNNSGPLGDGSNADRNLPVDVNGLTSGVAKIATAYETTCALLDSGSVKCWGGNAGSQLGDGTTNSSNVPLAIPGLTGVSDIAVGEGHVCALLSTGGAKCWGENYGGIGNGTVTNPVETPSSVVGMVDGALDKRLWPI